MRRVINKTFCFSLFLEYFVFLNIHIDIWHQHRRRGVLRQASRVIMRCKDNVLLSKSRNAVEAIRLSSVVEVVVVVIVKVGDYDDVACMSWWVKIVHTGQEAVFANPREHECVSIAQIMSHSLSELANGGAASAPKQKAGNRCILVHYCQDMGCCCVWVYEEEEEEK